MPRRSLQARSKELYDITAIALVLTIITFFSALRKLRVHCNSINYIMLLERNRV